MDLMSNDAPYPEPPRDGAAEPSTHEVSAAEAELDRVAGLDRLAAQARKSRRDTDRIALWQATFDLDRWWFIPRGGEGGWAPAAGPVDNVVMLFAFSSANRARRCAIDQGLVRATDPFNAMAMAPADVVRSVGTYVSAGVQALMMDIHTSGYFTPMQDLPALWKQVRGSLPTDDSSAADSSSA